MNSIFMVLSATYISGIFLFADSSLVSELSTFNPYSLLHLPLYGILTLLLFFSLNSFKSKRKIDSNTCLPHGPSIKNVVQSTDDPRPEYNSKGRNSCFFVVGLVGLTVAIADEIYQSYIPGRDASVTDVFLDLSGIILTLFFIFQIMEKKGHQAQR